MALSISGVQRASVHPIANSPRVFVAVYFTGSLPPILGYWSMN